MNGCLQSDLRLRTLCCLRRFIAQSHNNRGREREESNAILPDRSILCFPGIAASPISF